MLAKNLVRNTSILFCDISHNDLDMKDVIKIANHLDANLAAFEQAERSRRRDEAAEEKVQQEVEDGRNVSDAKCSEMLILLVNAVMVFSADFRILNN